MKVTKALGYALLVAALLFVYQSSFELYVLTPLRGPLMVFFSILHLWPRWLLYLFFGSWAAFYAYLLFAIAVSVLGYLRRFNVHRRYFRFIRATVLVFGLHLILMWTYEKWAYALFSKGS
jgi:hypothetical protein